MAKVENKKIADLKPDNSNANKGTERGLRSLDDSLATVGLGRSIVTDKHGNIIAGNKTTERAIDSGFEDAIVVRSDGKRLVVVQRDDLDLYDTDPNNPARKLAYYDNRVAELDLSWDAEQLLADVNAGMDFDGLFAQDEIDDIISELTVGDVAEDAGAQIDRAEELNETWQVERGQVWQIGKHRVMCGDSTSADDVETLMEGAWADAVVTDPPYGVSYADKNKFLNAFDEGNRIQTPIENDHMTVSDMSDLWLKVFSLMRDYCADHASYYITSPQGGELMMLMMMIERSGWQLKHCLIWVKNNHVLGRSDYNYKHEPILYGWNKNHRFYGGGQFKTSVWAIDKPHQSKEHPTMKPVELFAECVLNSTQADDVVMDLFTGSGTTIVACEQTGRIGYGMELEPKYVAVTLQRLADMGLTPEIVSTNQTDKK